MSYNMVSDRTQVDLEPNFFPSFFSQRKRLALSACKVAAIQSFWGAEELDA